MWEWLSNLLGINKKKKEEPKTTVATPKINQTTQTQTKPQTTTSRLSNSITQFEPAKSSLKISTPKFTDFDTNAQATTPQANTNIKPQAPTTATNTTPKLAGDLRNHKTISNKQGEDSWKKYYDREFYKTSSKQNFAQRLFDSGNASRRAEINARNRWTAEKLRSAYDDNGKVKNQSLADSLKSITKDNSSLAKGYADTTRAQLRQIGATADSSKERSRASNAFNALRMMDFGSGVIGADNTQKFDLGDVARFTTNLVPQGVPFLNVAYGVNRGAANVRDALVGKGTNYQTGRDKQLTLPERLGRGVSGSIDVVAPFFGGSETMAKSIKNALVGGTKNAATKQVAQTGAKAAIKNLAKDALQEGAEESFQQVADYYGEGGRLLDENGKLDTENVKDLAWQTAQAGALGALGGGLMHGAGMGIEKLKTSLDARTAAKIDAEINPKTNPVRNAVEKVTAMRNIGENVKSAYVDGKLPIPRTELTPNAGRNARMAEAIKNYPISESFNYGRVSRDTLAQHNAIQAQTGQDYVKNRDVTVYPNAHNAHVRQRILNEGLSPENYVRAAENAIYGKDRKLLPSKKGIDQGAQNVVYENPVNPSRAVMGQFNDGLSLKSVQQLSNDTLSPESKNTTHKRGFTDGVNLESPSGLSSNISQDPDNVKMKLADNPEKTHDGKNSQFAENTPTQTLEQAQKQAVNIDPDEYIAYQNNLQKRTDKMERRNAIKDTIAKLKHAFVDDATAYEAYMPQKGKTKQALRAELRNDIDNIRSSEMIAQQFIRDNELASIGKLNNKEMEQFQQYLIARRHASDLHKRGIETGRDLASDIAIINKYRSKFAAEERAYRNFNKALLNYMEDSGLISKAQHRAMNKNAAYAPFQRVMDGIGSFTGNSQQLGSLSSESVIRGIKGSERVIKNPIESTMANTMRIINEGLRNTAAKNISKNVFAENRLKDGQKPRAGYGTINYLENGKKVSYEVPELVAAEMKRLNRATGDGWDKVVKVLGAPTRALRTGATSANPMFAASNLVRDQFQTLITGKITTTLSPTGNLKAFAATFMPGEAGESLRAELARNGIIGSEYRQTYGYKPGDLITELQKENRLSAKAKDKLSHPIDTLADIIGRTEYYTRAQQYFGTKGDVVAKAQAARNNTLNFSRGGSVVMTLNKIIPFLNAGVQGGRQIVNQFKTRPVRTTVAFATMGAIMAAIRAANTANNSKKELYERITDSDKETNLIILGDDAKYNTETGRIDGITKIPIPQFLYPLADGINNSKGKPEDLMRIAGNILEAVSGIDIQNPVNQFTPTAIKPFIEAGFNKNSFTGQDLVSEYDANKNPEDKGAKYTSGIARKLARFTGVDAPIIDNFISNWGGGLAKDLATTMTDNPDNSKDAGGLKNMLSQGWYRRMSSAGANSQYAMTTSAVNELKEELKKDGNFMNLNKNDQEKILNALDTDAKSIGSLLGKAERGEDISDEKFSERQEGLLSGFNSGQYIEQVLKGSNKVNRERLYSENDYEYNQFKVEYDKKVAKGEYSKAGKLQATQKLKKLEVGKNYSKDTREAYELNKPKLRKLLEESDNPEQTLKDVLSYGDALVRAGLESKNKFRDKYGNISLADKKSSGRKSSTHGVSSWKIDTMSLVRGALNSRGAGSLSTASPKKYNLKRSAAGRQNVAVKRLGTTVKFAKGLYKK